MRTILLGIMIATALFLGYQSITSVSGNLTARYQTIEVIR